MRAGPNRHPKNEEEIIWEHGRRNFQLRVDGRLAIVCPVRDDTDVAGFGIFNLNEVDTLELMRDDPAVKAGVFICEIHATRSFAGDMLPL